MTAGRRPSATAIGGDLFVGFMAALIYLGEYLGQGAIANGAFNGGPVSALLTAVCATLLAVAFSARRNPLAGPRFLSVVCYAAILVQLAGLTAVRAGGALAAFALASLCVSLSGLWLGLIGLSGLGRRLRALLSVPALGALAFIVATTTIGSQLGGIGRCGEALAWPAILVAALVVLAAMLMKRTLAPGSLAHRARLCLAIALGAGVYFCWRAVAPTPALCGTVSRIQGAGLADALPGFWRWAAQLPSLLTQPECLLALLGGSLLLALLCLIDTVSAASALAGDEARPDADISGDLLASAVGNLLGGMCGLLPMSLSLSRSRTIAELKPAGRRLPALAHAASLLVLLGCLIPLQWPLLDYLPKAVIAGALVVVSIEMIDDKSVLLWRAGLGVEEGAARGALAGAAWIFLFALGVAMSFALSPWPALAVLAGLGAGLLASLAERALSARRRPAGAGPTGDLHFLNIGRALSRWSGGGKVDLSRVRALDFSAACALADLSRDPRRGVRLQLGPAASAQVRQMLAICAPEALYASASSSRPESHDA